MPVSCEPPRPPRSILLLEDDEVIRLGVSALLVRHGMAVVACGSLEEARAQLARPDQTPDVALIDRRLPDGNGLDLAFELLQGSRCGVVVVSGHLLPPEVSSLDYWGGPWLAKPYSTEELLAVIETASALARVEQALVATVGLVPLPTVLQATRRVMTGRALQASGGVKSRAAKLLGIQRQGIQYFKKAFGIHHRGFGSRPVACCGQRGHRGRRPMMVPLRMNRLLPGVVLLVAACIVEDAGPPYSAGEGVRIDGETKQVSLDPAQVPVLSGCEVGAVVRRGPSGWECARLEPATKLAAGEGLSLEDDTLSVDFDAVARQEHEHGEYRKRNEAIGWSTLEGVPDLLLASERYTDDEARAAVTWESVAPSVPAHAEWPGEVAASRVTGLPAAYTDDQARLAVTWSSVAPSVGNAVFPGSIPMSRVTGDVPYSRVTGAPEPYTDAQARAAVTWSSVGSTVSVSAAWPGTVPYSRVTGAPAGATWEAIAGGVAPGTEWPGTARWERVAGKPDFDDLISQLGAQAAVLEALAARLEGQEARLEALETQLATASGQPEVYTARYEADADLSAAPQPIPGMSVTFTPRSPQNRVVLFWDSHVYLLSGGSSPFMLQLDVLLNGVVQQSSTRASAEVAKSVHVMANVPAAPQTLVLRSQAPNGGTWRFAGPSTLLVVVFYNE